jgi:hypothetical protein
MAGRSQLQAGRPSVPTRLRHNPPRAGIIAAIWSHGATPSTQMICLTSLASESSIGASAIRPEYREIVEGAIAQMGALGEMIGLTKWTGENALLPLAAHQFVKFDHGRLDRGRPRVSVDHLCSVTDCSEYTTRSSLVVSVKSKVSTNA